MGMNISCFKAENTEIRSGVCTINTPTRSSTNERDHPPPLVGATDEGVFGKSRKKKKKYRFNWWEKKKSERQDQANDAVAVPSERNTKDQTFLPHVTVEIHQEESLASDPDVISTPDLPETPVLTELRVRSVSNWSVDSLQTPVLSRADSLVNFFQIRSRSDLSIDVDQNPVHSGFDLSDDIPHTSVSSQFDASDEIWCTQVNSGRDKEDEIWNTRISCESDGNDQIQQSPVNEEEFDINLNVYVRLEEINSCWYEIGDLLGAGGFGIVYEGRRVMDGLKVAVKFIRSNVDYISIPDHPLPLPREIALHYLANKGPSVPEIIQLLDWEDQPDGYVMVLEHFTPCMTLFDFMCGREEISDDMAQIIFWQAVKASYECLDRGVLHRDIKLENFLINPDTLDVKLIDFGCGDLLQQSAYNVFSGTKLYFCPEYFKTGEYHGESATVWSLGVLLFTMVCRRYPEFYDFYRIRTEIFYVDGLSNACCSLISACLQKNPEQRIRLDKIFFHNWFQMLPYISGLIPVSPCLPTSQFACLIS